jgi:HD-like signal output (HDOD) protein
MTRTVELTGTSLATRIMELVEDSRVQLQPLPEVAIRAQELVSDRQASVRHLGDLLSEDPAIVAALLRLANSPVFGGLGRIDTLTAAVQRIGVRQVAVIVTGVTP